MSQNKQLLYAIILKVLLICYAVLFSETPGTCVLQNQFGNTKFMLCVYRVNMLLPLMEAIMLLCILPQIALLKNFKFSINST